MRLATSVYGRRSRGLHYVLVRNENLWSPIGCVGGRCLCRRHKKHALLPPRGRRVPDRKQAGFLKVGMVPRRAWADATFMASAKRL